MKSKSPLKNRPLRLPGQSLDDEIKLLVEDKVIIYLIVPLIFIFITIWNWFLYYKIIKITNPALITVITIGVVIYSIFKLIKIRRRIKSMKLGRDGERAVGQFLDSLKSKGYKIFHDIIGDGFNLDHVIVCEHGVFCIETKTFSKPDKGQCKIIVTEEGISVNGRKPDKKIMVQARAQKSWLEKQIFLLTGMAITVKPVVVFPGWFVERILEDNQIWFLEPKALPSFIGNSRKIFEEQQIKLISNHLSRFIRSKYDYKPL